MKAWLVRGVKSGAHDEVALSHGRSIIGFQDVGDLSSYNSREEIIQYLNELDVGDSDNARRTYAAQLFAFSKRIQQGDYIVMPLRRSPQIAIGRVEGDYEFLSGNANQDLGHTRKVHWLQTDIPRTAIKQDLLNSLGAFLTVANLSRNDALQRIERLAKDMTDPGMNLSLPSSLSVEDDVNADREAETRDLYTLNVDRVSKLIQQEFTNHDLPTLVAAILTAKGFKCEVSSEGTDGGVDIIAGTGPLGLGSPKLVVQVKSQGTPVGDPVLQQLHGVIQRNDAEQGLLVALGGITRPAKIALEGERFRIAVWHAENLVEELFETYHLLPENIRVKIPMRKAWILDDTGM